MMHTDVKWKICVTCDGCETGPDMDADWQDVLSKLAALRAALPAGWDVEAFMVLELAR